MSRLRSYVEYFRQHYVVRYQVSPCVYALGGIVSRNAVGDQTPRTPLEKRLEIASHIHTLAQRLATLFVRYATLVFPLHEEGKVKLTSMDCVLCFAEHCPPV